MLPDKYFDELRKDIQKFSPIISSEKVFFENRSPTIGKIKGDIIFIDLSKLLFLEIFDATEIHYKLGYSYHYQNHNKNLIFRYDNAPHHRISSFPHHKHIPDKVLTSTEPSLHLVLEEIFHYIYK